MLNADQGPKGQESKCRQSLEVCESQELRIKIASCYFMYSFHVTFSLEMAGLHRDPPRSRASKVPNQVDIMDTLKILIACSIWTLIAKVRSDLVGHVESHSEFRSCALGVSTMEMLKSFQNNIPFDTICMYFYILY